MKTPEWVYTGFAGDYFVIASLEELAELVEEWYPPNEWTWGEDATLDEKIESLESGSAGAELRLRSAALVWNSKRRAVYQRGAEFILVDLPLDRVRDYTELKPKTAWRLRRRLGLPQIIWGSDDNR